jgi:hypothetical protein
MSASIIVPSEQLAPARVSRALLPGSEVEARLVSALQDLDTARKSAVIWFGEILARKLYLEFGCSSIYHYASTRLGFSRARTAYFLRLCRSFEALPALKESVATGAVPWTKAREVLKVVTPETESFWVEQARTAGRRELERRVAATRGAARSRRRAPGQGELLAAVGAGNPADGQAGGEHDSADGAAGQAANPVTEVSVTVSFQLSPEQYARYEAMLECARKSGLRGSREELFLAAWEMLTRVSRSAVEAGSGGDDQLAAVRETRGREARSEPRYQIVIRQCETCGRAEIATGRGAMPIAPKMLEAALCDARRHRKGEKNRATIPPSVRREVMARDGHRCRTAGCGGAHFLDVHHIVPRALGGTNDPENLATLCSACHRMIHERVDGSAAWPLRRGSGIDAHPGGTSAA